LRDWLQGKKAAKATGTFLKYRRTIESFLAFLGTKAKRNLSQVTPRDIQRFRDAELAVGKHPTTCNSVVKHLRIPFTSARRQGLITHNPAEGVEMLNVKGQGSKGTFNHEQVKALVGAAHGDWRGAILTAYYTGARLQDVANLRWDSVDREKGLISFVARKTDQQLRIPIHPELQEYLLNLAVVDGSFVFPTLKGTGSGGKSGLSMAFSRIMGRANVRGEVAREAHGKGRRINTLSFHSLRHSFNSALANAGVPQEIRQTLTGHTSAEMNRRYTHHDLAPLRAAIAVLPCLDAPLGS
jgi:integrase